MSLAEDRDSGEVMETEVEVLVGEVRTREITRAATFQVAGEVQPLSIQTRQRRPTGGTCRPAHREVTTGAEISKGQELQMWDSRDRPTHSPVTPFLPLPQAHSVMPVARLITISLAVLS